MEARHDLLTRSFSVRVRDETGTEEKPEMWVEGYAVRFESPTVLFEYDGTEYKEQIDRNAFEECQMEDVIFNYNHGGKVMARTRNQTLFLEIRSDGLYIRARLDGTEEGRRLYEEIKGGYIDRMSFRFSVREEAYDKQNHMWTVRRIKRLYDVSAVDIPAYDDTSISARKQAVMDLEERRKRLELDKRKTATEIENRMRRRT